MREVNRYLWELPESQRTPEVKALIERVISEAETQYDLAFEAGYLEGIAETKAAQQ